MDRSCRGLFPFRKRSLPFENPFRRTAKISPPFISAFRSFCSYFETPEKIQATARKFPFLFLTDCSVLSLHFYERPLFFLCLASSDPHKFLPFSERKKKKKKGNDVVKPMMRAFFFSSIRTTDPINITKYQRQTKKKKWRMVKGSSKFCLTGGFFLTLYQPTRNDI